jgi:predicted nucleic-acid-binding Zn-ribbon protein
VWRAEVVVASCSDFTSALRCPIFHATANLMSIPVAEHIRKLGFRRWHERQLVEAHASLVTAFLCVIVVAVCLDQLQWRDGGVKPLIMLALIVAGIALCFKAVSFYFKMLFRAEHFAQQAVCSHCKVYGAIEIITTSAADSNNVTDERNNDWLKIRCKRCGHDWTMTTLQTG